MSRELKNYLYEQVALMGKALSSPKRLELLELLAQEEKSVELLAKQSSISVKLASAHLKVLRAARLIEPRRDGRFVYYRVSGEDVSSLWATLHTVATEHLVELRVALDTVVSGRERLDFETRRSLLKKAQKGEVVVLDVRPESEYRVAHLPFARSIPLEELERRISELPNDVEIVAYCRGPFCLLSNEAVTILLKRGYQAHKIGDGVAEWVADGLSIESNS